MRVLLADNQPKVRFALRVLLERQSGIEIVGEATNTADLLSQMEKTHPDIVLLSWDLPGLATNGPLSSLRERYPKLSVIALSGRPEVRRAALSAGANAFVSKTDPPERLLATIRRYQPAQRKKAPALV
jgi:DNA-binding NarL/FixJ family response regulator